MAEEFKKISELDPTESPSSTGDVPIVQGGTTYRFNPADLPISDAVQTALDAKASSTTVSDHTGNTSNPHSVTKTQVGLGNVDNTSDVAKPVSTATQTALDAKADTTDLADFETTTELNARDTANRSRTNHTGTQSADTITDGTTNKAYTASEKTKLAGIATGATANSTDATLLARANHTGTQAISTVTGLQTALDGKLEDVDIADINATGTASDTTYLRGDGSWSTPAGGGGGGAVDSVNGETGTVVLDQDDVLDGTTYKQYSATEKTKLSGIATGATANDTDANLKNRANHTGTQTASTISDFDTEVSNNTDVAANTASRHTHANSTVLDNTTASFTTDDETKLDGIEALADVTDATNVAAAGAVMEADTSTASMSFVIDEDNMASDSATKVPTQQSVKAYVDASGGGASAIDDLSDVTISTPGDGQVLTYDSGTSQWVNENSASGFSNPMTTEGDIIYGGASGTATRLAKGSDGDVLTLASGVPSWAAASGGGGGSVDLQKLRHYRYVFSASDDQMYQTLNGTVAQDNGTSFTITADSSAYVRYTTRLPAIDHKYMWDSTLVVNYLSRKWPTYTAKMNLCFGTGEASFSSFTGKAIGWRNDTGANTVLARNANGTAETSTDCSATLPGNSLSVKALQAVHTPAVNDKFYSNGTLVATHTTNVPAGDGYSQTSWWGMQLGGSGSVAASMIAGEMDMWQQLP